MPRKASVVDVAQRAGVSVGTVSHALNHPEKVSPATLERVETAIRELGFIRSASARQLRARQSTAVGVVVLDLANPFYMEAARAIENHIAEAGLAMMLSSTDGVPDREDRVVRMLLEQEVRGVILTPAGGSVRSIELLRHHGMRTVLLDSPADVADVDSVGMNDTEGGRLAVAHLLELGHRRIAVVTGPLDMRQGRARLDGARQAVVEAGLDPDDVLEVRERRRFSADEGAAAMDQLLDHAVGCSATFCANDVMAIGVIRTLRERGLSLPDDMALVGYDDIPVAAQLITPLTSVRQPMARLGQAAAELLLDEQLTAQHLVFRPDLVVRESTTGVS